MSTEEPVQSPVCEPCSFDDVSETAVGFCVVCVEYLCESCCRHHKRNKSTRNHAVLKDDDIPKSPSAYKQMKDLMKCCVHSEYDVMYRCGDHAAWICMVCIAKDHRKCDDIQEIKDHACKAADVDTLTQLRTKTLQLREDNEAILNTLHDDAKTLTSDCEHFAKTLHTQVNVVGQQTCEQLTTLADEETRSIKSDIDICEAAVKGAASHVELQELATRYGSDEHKAVIRKYKADAIRQLSNQVKSLRQRSPGKLKLENRPILAAIEPMKVQMVPDDDITLLELELSSEEPALVDATCTATDAVGGRLNTLPRTSSNTAAGRNANDDTVGRMATLVDELNVSVTDIAEIEHEPASEHKVTNDACENETAPENTKPKEKSINDMTSEHISNNDKRDATPELLESQDEGGIDATPELLESQDEREIDATPELLESKNESRIDATPELLESQDERGIDATPELLESKNESRIDATPELLESQDERGIDATPELLESQDESGIDATPELLESQDESGKDATPELLESKDERERDVTPELLESQDERGIDATPELLEPKDERGIDATPELLESQDERERDVTPELLESKDERERDVTPELLEFKNESRIDATPELLESQDERRIDATPELLESQDERGIYATPEHTANKDGGENDRGSKQNDPVGDRQEIAKINNARGKMLPPNTDNQIIIGTDTISNVMALQTVPTECIGFQTSLYGQTGTHQCGQHVAVVEGAGFKCDPCKFDGVYKDATCFCVTCAEYMCNDCRRHHSRSKITRSHVILSHKAIPNDRAPYQQMADIVKCPVHPMKEVVYECVEHAAWICTSCAIGEHRKCSVVELTNCEEASQSEQPDIMETLHQTVSDIKCEREGNIKSLDQDKQSVMNDIHDVTQELHHHIELQQTKVAEKIITLERSEGKVFDTNISDCNTLLDGILASCMELHHVATLYGSRDEQTITGTYINETLQQASRQIESVQQSTKHSHLQLQRKKGICEMLTLRVSLIPQQMTSIANNEQPRESATEDLVELHEVDSAPLADRTDGQTSAALLENSGKDAHANPASALDGRSVQDKAVQVSIPKIQLHSGVPTDSEVDGHNNLLHAAVDKNHFCCDVGVSGDKCKCRVSGIIALTCGAIALIDYSNENLKVLDKDFNQIACCSLPCQPIDICLFDKSSVMDNGIRVYTYTVAICFHKLKQILFYNIRDENVYFSRRFATKLYALSLSTDEYGLAILFSNRSRFNTDSSEMEIQYRLPSGEIMDTLDFCKDDDLRRIHLADGRLYRSNRSNLHAYRHESMHQVDLAWFYKSTKNIKINDISDIDTDSDGNVYVCAEESDYIHQIARNNYRVSRQLFQLPFSAKAISIAFDAANRRLLVGYRDTEFITVHSLL